MEFGKKLKKLRLNHSMTQEKLGSKLNVSRKAVSSWENNRSYPDINTLLQISNLYKISINDLFKENDDLLDNYEKKIKWLLKTKDFII